MSDDRDDECGKIHPNLRDICRCERAGISLEQCNRRRHLWGLSALNTLPVDDSPPDSADDHRPMSIAERAMSFASVMIQSVYRNVVWKDGLLSEEQMQARLEICRSCPKLIDSHCLACGCRCVRENHSKWLTKIAHASAECPLKKWGRAEASSDR